MSARVNPTLLGRVLELWGMGQSAGKIAEQLNLTRNQAMGMIHRARLRGLCANHEGVNFKPGPLNGHRPRKRHKPVKLSPTIVKVEELDYINASLRLIAAPPPAVWPEPVPCVLPSGAVFGWYADGGCRFILNEDTSHPRWCNQPTWGGPWCEQHQEIVYTRYVPKI